MRQEILLGMLFTLLSHDRVSAERLAEKYEICKRSVYRYIMALELANVPIYVNKGRYGGYSVADTYKLPVSFFTDAEYSAVLTALKAVNGELHGSILDSAIEKIEANVKRAKSGFAVRGDGLIIDGGPWGNATGYKTKLQLLEKCVAENLVLEIDYCDREGEVTHRTIEPHTLVFKQGLWYVYAFCHMRGEFRLFKIGRIGDAHLTEKTFVKRCFEGVTLPFEQWVSSSEIISAEFQADKTLGSDLEEWLGVENVWRKGDGYFAAADLPFDRGLVSKILSYGAKLKVISPSQLREQVISVAKEIAAEY